MTAVIAVDIEEIKRSILGIRHDVVSIVVFGSFARGKEYFNDIDMLVIVEDAPKGFLDRKKDICEIVKTLKIPVRLEILLYTREECKTNFYDHIPLFIEIAFDGKVIYDRDFIAPIMRNTREEVKNKGIERVGIGGWQFPVRFREATLLSPLSNRDWAEIWLKEGVLDLQAAEKLFEACLYAKCATHCQQAIEKAAKAILACFGRFERSHYIAGLLEEKTGGVDLSGWESDVELIIRYTRESEPDAVWSRYPGERDGELWIPEKEYTLDKAKEALERARFCCEKSDGFVKWWFAK